MKLAMPHFERARVLVLGDVMLDRYWQGGAARISPEAPVPVVRVEDMADRPGGAGNVALNIAALGTAVALGGFTGDDEMADSLEAMLAGAGVDCHFIRLEDHSTITKLRVISRQQQLLRLDFEDEFPTPRGDSLRRTLADRLPGAGPAHQDRTGRPPAARRI